MVGGVRKASNEYIHPSRIVQSCASPECGLDPGRTLAGWATGCGRQIQFKYLWVAGLLRSGAAEEESRWKELNIQSLLDFFPGHCESVRDESQV